MRTYKISFAILFLTIAGNILCQTSGSAGVSDARSAAMGRTYTESATGLSAIGANPANLFRDSARSVELVLPLPLPNIGGSIGTNFMTIDDYNYFFGTQTTDATGKKIGRTLTFADKQRFNNLFSNGGTITTNLQIQLFAVSIKPINSFGTLGFSIIDQIAGTFTLPKELVNIGLNGNLANTVYNFNDTKLNAWWLRKYSFSYARNLDFVPFFKSFSLGVSINMIQGYAYTELDHMNTELTTGVGNVITGKGDFLLYSAFSPDFHIQYSFDKSTSDQKYSFSPFPTPAGSGVGVDIGLSAKLNDVLSFGFAVTDIGSITWNKNVAQYSSNKAVYLDDLTSQSQRDSLTNALTGKDNGRYTGNISSQLATALRLGAAIQIDKMVNGNFPGKMLVAIDYNQGFNDQPGNTTKPRTSIGADWVLGTIAVRSGFSFGGIDNFNWGFGLGLDFGILALNFGTPDMESLISSNSAKRVSFAFDSRWRF